MTGQVKRPEPVVLDDPEFKQKIKDFLQKLSGNEDISSNYFHDAKEELVETSKKKKEAKSKKRNKKVNSEDEESSDSSFNMSSVSSINTNCTPEVLRYKAERKISKLRKFLKQEQSEESLKDRKRDAKSLIRKLEFYMNPQDQALEELIEEIEAVLIEIGAKIEEKKKLN